MEVLAGASGVISVLGVTLQLAHSIKKTCEFWDSIEEAPNEIQTICSDLHIISNILEEIEAEQTLSQHSTPSTVQALAHCSQVLKSLNDLGGQIGPYDENGGRLSRKWWALRTVLKMDKLERLRKELDYAKASLVLERQNTTTRVTWDIYKSQQQLAAVVDDMKSQLRESLSTTTAVISNEAWGVGRHLEVLEKESKVLASKIKNPMTRLGFERAMSLAFLELSKDFPNNSMQFRYTTNTNGPYIIYSRLYKRWSSLFGSILLNRTGTQTTVNVRPSAFLRFLGLDNGFKMNFLSSPAITCTLQPYRAVPDDAVIFKLSSMGLNREIVRLFEDGLASPSDTDSYGRTPLMFAIVAGKVDTCKLLVANGADQEVRDERDHGLGFYTTGTYYDPDRDTYEPGKYSSEEAARSEDRLDIFKMFSGQLDFTSDLNCSGLLCYRRMCAMVSADSCRPHGEYHFVVTDGLSTLLQEQVSLGQFALSDTHSTEGQLREIFLEAMLAENWSVFDRFLTAFGPMNKPYTCDLAHYLGFEIRRSDQTSKLSFLTSRGLDLHRSAHREGFNVWRPDDNGNPITYGPPLNTITSQTLRFSLSFFRFRNTLRALGIDIATFITDELKQKPLSDAGWTPEGLQSLFDLDFTPLAIHDDTRKECEHEMGIEYSWEIMLEKLKVRNISSKSIKEILLEREADIVRFKEEEDWHHCFVCREIKRAQKARGLDAENDDDNSGNNDDGGSDDEEDSMFLLSI